MTRSHFFNGRAMFGKYSFAAEHRQSLQPPKPKMALPSKLTSELMFMQQDKHGIEIVNETGLTQMLESTDAKFDPEILAILRDSRKFCPKCESEMVLRTASKGLGAGKKFWGCSTYPRCRYRMPVA